MFLKLTHIAFREEEVKCLVNIVYIACIEIRISYTNIGFG